MVCSVVCSGCAPGVLRACSVHTSYLWDSLMCCIRREKNISTVLIELYEFQFLTRIRGVHRVGSVACSGRAPGVFRACSVRLAKCGIWLLNIHSLTVLSLVSFQVLRVSQCTPRARPLHAHSTPIERSEHGSPATWFTRDGSTAAGRSLHSTSICRCVLMLLVFVLV